MSGWCPHPEYAGVETLIVDGVEVGWVEPETERVPALSGPYKRTGRWHFGVDGSKGGRSSKALAKRAVERSAS